MLHVLQSIKNDPKLENEARTSKMLRSGFMSIGTKKVIIFAMMSNAMNGSKYFIQKITKGPNLENKI